MLVYGRRHLPIKSLCLRCTIQDMQGGCRNFTDGILAGTCSFGRVTNLDLPYGIFVNISLFYPGCRRRDRDRKRER